MMYRKMTNWLTIAVLLFGAIILLTGCSKSGDQAGDKLRSLEVGAILPLTGPAASYGEAGQRGILLAKDAFIEKHPELSAKVTIRFEDDKASPKDGLSAFQKLRSDRVPIIVGPMVSGVALAITSGMEENDQLLMILPTATNPKLRGISPNVFRTCVSDDVEGSAMAQYVIRNLPNRTVGVLHINNEYGLGLATAFMNLLGEMVVAREAYDPSAMDFRNVILKVLQEKPYAVFLVGQKEQERVITQLRELGFTGQILGTTMFEDPTIFSLSAANGVIFSSRVLNNGEIDGASHPFFKRFRDRFGSDANYYAAACFDAATVALESSRLYLSTDLALLSAPRQIGIDIGATGSMHFDDKNDVEQGFVIKQLSDGKTMILEK